MHSDLDATRRLGELKSEFVESPSIKIDLISPKETLNGKLAVSRVEWMTVVI